MLGWLMLSGSLLVICAWLAMRLRRQKRAISRAWRRRPPLAPGAMPAAMRYRYHKPIAILAHRGLSQYATENSGPAISLAAMSGVNGIEIDVRFTADQVPVLYHDRLIERAPGNLVAVSMLRFEELSSIRLPPANRILTLAQFFEQFGDQFNHIMLDIKRDDTADLTARANELADLLRRHNAVRRVVVDSVNVEFAAAAAAFGLIASVRRPLISPQELKRIGIHHVCGINYAEQIDDGNWQGLSVIVNCKGDAELAIRFIDRGAFAVITDVPEQLLNRLEARRDVTSLN